MKFRKFNKQPGIQKVFIFILTINTSMTEYHHIMVYGHNEYSISGHLHIPFLKHLKVH